MRASSHGWLSKIKKKKGKFRPFSTLTWHVDKLNYYNASIRHNIMIGWSEQHCRFLSHGPKQTFCPQNWCVKANTGTWLRLEEKKKKKRGACTDKFYLLWHHVGPGKCYAELEEIGWSSAMLCEMLSWETFGSDVHGDATLESYHQPRAVLV